MTGHGRVPFYSRRKVERTVIIYKVVSPIRAASVLTNLTSVYSSAQWTGRRRWYLMTVGSILGLETENKDRECVSRYRYTSWKKQLFQQ